MLTLPRYHLFEWEDQSFCPEFIRDALTNYLNCIWCTGRFYRSTLPIIQQGLEYAENHQIMDLCSGGGGAVPAIQRALSAEIPDLQMILSDFYPNQSAFERLSRDTAGRVTYVPHAVDARTYRHPTAGMYTMFLALHHFTPSDVQKILKTRTDNRDVIAIFEIQQRRLWDLALMLVHFPLSWILMPFLRPTLLQVIFTYLIPVIPCLIVWDGMVSTLRTYSEKELVEMMEDGQLEHYSWTFGSLFHPLHRVNYCLGVPK